MGFNHHILCALLCLEALSLKAEKIDFARDIRPVLSDACYNCHGPDKKARKAKLRLDDRKTAVESGVFSDPVFGQVEFLKKEALPAAAVWALAHTMRRGRALP